MAGSADKPSSAQTVKCRFCGSSIPIETFSPTVQCPYCGKRQALDPQALAQLKGYQDKVAGAFDKIRQEQKHMEGWDRWYGHMRGGSGGKHIFIIFGIVMGLPLLLMGGFMALQGLGVQVQKLGPFVGLFVMAIVMVSIFGYMIWMYTGKGKKTGDIRMEQARLVCPGCGAPHMMQPGQVLDKCQYCGSMLMPSETVMQESVASVNQAVRAAQMQRFRAEREGMAKVMSYSAGGYVHYMVLGPFALMTGAGAIMFSVEMMRGKEPYSPSIFIAWAMFFTCIALLVGISWWKSDRKKRWQRALGELARQFHGQVAANLTDIVGWLNLYWAGPYNIVNLTHGPYGNGAALVIEGFPAFVFTDPVAASEHHKAKVHLFLAAWIPGLSDPPEEQGAVVTTVEAEAARQWISQNGFDVRAQQAGLLAEAGEDTVKWLRKHPEDAAALAPIFMKMARMAASLDGRPVQPVP